MSLSTRFPPTRFLTPRRHIQGSLLLVVMLCSAAGGCAKPLRGVATVIGVKNTMVQSPQPPAPPPTDRRGAETVKHSADRTVKPPGRLASVAEAPRALGTSGLSLAEPARASSAGTRTDAAASATSTSGQGQVDSAAKENPRLVPLVTIPLTIVAIIAAIVVGRRVW
jgi:hypothetical protein